MKKVLLLFMAIFAFGLNTASAQDAPLKIVTNHPDFKIKVKRCAASGKTVIIDLVFSNEGTTDIENIRVNAGGWGAEIYDDEGNIYKNSDISVKVANSKVYDNSFITFNIPSGVPMKVSFQINNVSNEAESLARFKLPIDCDSWGLEMSKPVRIDNVPITRN